MKRHTLAVSAALILYAALAALLVSCATEPPTTELDDSYYTNLFNYTPEDSMLGRGMNLGNFFEAPKTAQHSFGEGGWNGGVIASRDDFSRMYAAGFKSVRIPSRWSDHAAHTAPWTIDSAFLSRVREVVDLALEENLVVVLNTHHYEEMMKDGRDKLAGHRERLKGIWAQLSAAFPIADYPADRLVFELLNEPNGTVGYDDWNAIIAELCTVIWTDAAATQTGRKIMVGTANWGGVPGLQRLELPAACTSENTIVTIHYYEPFRFTHQGAEWSDGASAWIGTRWLGTKAEQRPLTDLLDQVVSWNAQAGRGFEIYMGEFGVYTKYANPDDQKAWTAFIAREAERRKMSWAYWEYCAGFGAYDYQAGSWRPALLSALIPQN